MLQYEALLRLTDTIAASLANVSPSDSEIREAVDHLRHAAAGARPRATLPQMDRYATLLERTLEQAEHSPLRAIARQLQQVHRGLPWVYHYLPRTVAEDLGDRIAFAELIGPDGPLNAPSCRVGFTLMDEQTIYPFHAHPAVELYWIVLGTAHWLTPTSMRKVPPGELVLHRSNEPHAMRTDDEPLLALWAWSGDVDAPAAYT